MNERRRLLRSLTTACTLMLAIGGAFAQVAEQAGDAAPSYTPLSLLNLPVQGDFKNPYSGVAQLGLGYTSDNNYVFGEYNGLSKQGGSLIGNLQWQDFHSSDNYWQVSLADLGLDTRQVELTWGRPDRLRIRMGFDSQQQVRNDSGKTPFRGSVNQYLPDSWVSGQTTADFATLNDSLQNFDRVLNRDKLFMTVDAKLNDSWQLQSNFSYEQKKGHGELGAGIYIDGALTDAVLLRSPVDYGSTEFDLSLAYDGARLHLNGQLAYSHFNNDNKLLVWQNPYNAYGPNVAYPNGTGGLGLAPDNEQVSGRLTGHYIFSSRARLQFDGSYAVASQDDSYPGYTVNEALRVSVAVPRADLDGEVATSTGNIRLRLTPLPKLSAQLYYKLRERNYDADRNGYLYVRGDGSNQPHSLQTVYNSNHDLTSQTAGFEFNYRLPLRSKLGLEYSYEEVRRRNAAVEKTKADRYVLSYRIQPWPNFTSKLHLEYADRAADTSEWAQAYYALLDTQLINITPDNQRYINHPLLSSYHLANRERWESRADFSYVPAEHWNLNLNLRWRQDDYDQSILGLTESRWQRAHFSVSYILSSSLYGSVYTSFDSYEGRQRGRAFRGGQEKNAFAIYTPLPQASDPQQDWDIDTTDTSITFGANLQWQVAQNVELKLEFSFVDTRAQQAITTQPRAGVIASDLPNVNTRLHHTQASGTWHMRDNLSLQLDYQYHSFKSDDWAWENVRADTIARVLTFGQSNPDEDIHYLGASVIFHWR